MKTINLVTDHGRTQGPGEKAIIARMLQNAYDVGVETGIRSSYRQGLSADLKWRLSGLKAFIAKLKGAIGKTD